MIGRHPMYIDIKAVRSVSRICLDIPLGSRTVLVGPNNSGKSTILDFIQLALHTPCILEQRAHDKRPTKGAFLTSMYRLLDGAPQRPCALLSFTPNELDLGPPGDPGTIEIRCTARLHPRRVDPAITGVTELLPISIVYRNSQAEKTILSFDDPQLSPNVLDRDEIDLAPQIWLDEEAAGRERWDPDAFSITRLKPYSLAGLPLLKGALFQKLRACAARSLHLSADRRPQFEPSHEDVSLAQDRLDNVTPYLKRLRYDDVTWPLFTSACRGVFEEIDDICFVLMLDKLTPFVKFRGEVPLPINDVGTGLRNTIGILAALFSAPPNSLITIDEPEIGLNQARQLDLAQVLERVRPDATVIMSTQAEAFCKGLNSSRLIVVEPAPEGATVRPLDIRNRIEDRRKLGLVMGVEPLFLAAGGRILYVEGKSDAIILREWLDRAIPGSGDIRVEQLGGCGSLRADFAKPMFEEFHDRIFFLVDSDGTSDTQSRAKNAKAFVKWLREAKAANYHVLKRREIENYLPAARLAAAAGVVMDDAHVEAASSSVFVDVKAILEARSGRPYDVRWTVAAYRSLTVEERSRLFADEEEEIRCKIKRFLQGGRDSA